METENLKHLCGIHLEEARLRKKNITTVSIVTSIILIICVSLISNIKREGKQLAEELESVYAQLENQLGKIPKELTKELTMDGFEILKNKELYESIDTFIALAKENIKEENREKEFDKFADEIRNIHIEIGKLLNRRNILQSTHVPIKQLQHDSDAMNTLYRSFGDTSIGALYDDEVHTKIEKVIQNSLKSIIGNYTLFQKSKKDFDDMEVYKNYIFKHTVSEMHTAFFTIKLGSEDIISKYDIIYELLKDNSYLENYPITILVHDYSSIFANINKLAELMGVSVEEKYYKMKNDIPSPKRTMFLSVVRKIKEDTKNKIVVSKEESKVITKIYGFEISLSVGSLIFMFPVVFSLYIPMIYMMIVQYHIHLNTGAAFEKKILSNTIDNHNIDPEIIWQVKGKQKGFGNWLCYPGRLQQTLFQLFIGIMMIYIIYRSYLLIEMIHSFFYLMVYVGIITTSFGVIAWLTIIILRREIPEPIYQSPAGVQGNTDKT